MSEQARPDAQRYRLERRIATGGMGEVWQARDTVLGRQVAVKLLKPEYAGDATFRSRFEAEARHAAALHHPGIASVFDFGEMVVADGPAGSEGTRPFLVMELVAGEPLSALLRTGEPMPPATAADLVAQAADALAAAHASGIVHRDVKPANLLVTPEGQVKITDFGIARAADSVALTQTGQVVGTPHYLSPEQAEGHPATPASDVYALGVVLFECLTGVRPFAADSPMGTALAHIREPVPPLPEELPAHLRAAVTKALAKDPQDRYPSAADLAAALRGDPVAAAGGTSTPTATQVLSSSGSSTGGRRRRLPAWLPWAGAALAVLLVVGGVSLFGGGGTDNAGPPDSQPSSQPSSQASDRPSDQQGAAAGEQVRVRRADYVGRPSTVARDDLDRRGLHARVEPRANPGGETAGVVSDVRPLGLVDRGSTVVLVAWGPPPAPEPTPTTESPAPQTQAPKPHGGEHTSPGHQNHGHKNHGHPKPGKSKGKK